MHKIYSRRRFLIPRIKHNKSLGKIKNRENRHNKVKQKILKILIILIIAFSIVNLVSQAVQPVFDTLCKDEARSIATKITNEEATNVMKQFRYEDLFSIEKDSDGNITMIKSNVFPINEIISNIAVKIQEGINNEGRDNIKIALGTFTGIDILAGRGPNVNIKVASIGNVETDLKSEFSQQGINQTLHRVYLQIECHVSILTPFSVTEESITNQVLIAENVIVGQIPSNYYNLEGVNNTRAVDIIE